MQRPSQRQDACLVDRLFLTGLLGAGAALAAPSFVFGGLALAAGWGLFSRFERETILNQTVRAEIHQMIQMRPGITFAELREGLGLSNSCAMHHLALLEQHELIRRVRTPYRTHFFLRGPRTPAPEELDEVRNRIRVMLLETPRLSGSEIARRLGMTRQATYYHLRRLKYAGALACDRRGRTHGWVWVESSAAPLAPEASLSRAPLVPAA